LIKSIHKNPRGNITLSGERLNVFPLRPGKTQGCSLSPLQFNIELEVLARAIRQEKEIKAIHVRKEDITIYLGNPKES